MNRQEALAHFQHEVENIKEAGTFKGESPIVSSQSAHVINGVCTYK